MEKWNDGMVELLNDCMVESRPIQLVGGTGELKNPPRSPPSASDLRPLVIRLGGGARRRVSTTCKLSTL